MLGRLAITVSLGLFFLGACSGGDDAPPPAVAPEKPSTGQPAPIEGDALPEVADEQPKPTQATATEGPDSLANSGLVFEIWTPWPTLRETGGLRLLGRMTNRGERAVRVMRPSWRTHRSSSDASYQLMVRLAASTEDRPLHAFHSGPLDPWRREDIVELQPGQSFDLHGESEQGRPIPFFTAMVTTLDMVAESEAGAPRTFAVHVVYRLRFTDREAGLAMLLVRPSSETGAKSPSPALRRTDAGTVTSNTIEIKIAPRGG